MTETKEPQKNKRVIRFTAIREFDWITVQIHDLDPLVHSPVAAFATTAKDDWKDQALRILETALEELSKDVG